MASTYVNDLRLEEMATGDQSGTWGDTTNTNLELIAEAFSYGTEASFGSDADATTTIADGASDPARSLYLKVTSGASLTATRTLTIAPNTVSKIWIIENATSGSQSINISQGSGANVTIPNGDVKVIYTDGAGAGAAVVDAFTDLNLSGTTTVAALDAGSGAITTTGTVTGGTLAGTLSTAAQPNITSLGTLTALTGGTGDLNWDSGTLFVDSSANAVGIGTTSPSAGYILDARGWGNFQHPTGDSLIKIQTGNNTGTSLLYFSDSDSIFSGSIAYLHTDDAMRFNTNATERLRIDSSGNVGIGVTNPTQKLHVKDVDYTRIQIEAGTTSHGAILNLGDSSDADYGSITQFASAAGEGGRMRFVAGATETMNLRGGNVGIGTSSPTDFGSGFKTLQVTSANTTSGGVFRATNSDSSIVTQFNTNETGGFVGTITSHPLVLGTANSEKMRIDSSGNVGIGTSSPSVPLDVVGSGKFQPAIAGGDALVTIAQTNSNAYIHAGVKINAGNTNPFYIYQSGSSNTLRFNYNSLSDAGGQMVITDGGNVGIGTSSPSGRLSVIGSNNTNQVYISGETGGTGRGLRIATGTTGFETNDIAILDAQASSSGTLVFQTRSTERMRIDSSGNVGIGTTSPINSNYFSVLETNNNTVSVIWNSNTGFTNIVQQLLASRNTTNSSYEFLRCSINGVADKLKIYDSGDVQNTNNSYGSLSDLKLKENIVDTTPKLEKIKQVQVRNYTLKETGDKHIGVIAQELETVFPNLVEEYTDRDENGNDLGTTSKGVKYSVFVPILIKAIQEQQAQIEALQSEINLLKGE